MLCRSFLNANYFMLLKYFPYIYYTLKFVYGREKGNIHLLNKGKYKVKWKKYTLYYLFIHELLLPLELGVFPFKLLPKKYTLFYTLTWKSVSFFC